MKSETIRDIAIKRHDEDAGTFQKIYSDIITQNKEYAFKYGRKLILDDLQRILDGLPKNARILDLGSGTGHLAKSLHTQGFEVIGAEPSLKMLEIARNNFPDIEFVEGISSKLPFPDQHFDLVIAFEVFRYLDKKENQKSFTEVFRTLKPGGHFFFTQVNRYSSDGYFLFFYVKKFFQKILGKLSQHCFFTTPKQQVKLLERSGFSKIETLGRMAGTIRMGYKLGKFIGDRYVKLVEKIYGDQKFKTNPLKSMAGHLVVIARK